MYQPAHECEDDTAPKQDNVEEDNQPFKRTLLSGDNNRENGTEREVSPGRNVDRDCAEEMVLVKNTRNC